MPLGTIIGICGILFAAAMVFILDHRFQKRRDDTEALHAKHRTEKDAIHKEYTDKIAEITDGFIDTLVEVVTAKDKVIFDHVRTSGEMLLAKSALDYSTSKEKIIKAEKGEKEEGADPIKRPFERVHGIRKQFEERYGPMMRGGPVATVKPGNDPLADKERMERKKREKEPAAAEFVVR